MARDEPRWEAYRSFLAVMTEGSLSAAARKLALTQPTLGRHIDELEEALGQKLFTRSQTGLIPAQAARELLPHAQAMASAADALVRASSAGALDERGTVRLTASRIVGAEVLPAILTSFHEKYPGIAIELVLTDVAEDLLKREADIAVRMVRPKQESLVAKKIGTVRLGLFAHRRYLALHGTPQSIDDAPQHTLIGFDRETAMVRSLRDRGMKLTRDMFGLRSDNDLAQIAALRAGYGLGVCQLGIARRDPDLVHILPTKFIYDLEMWLCMHKDLRGTHRMRLLFDHLAMGLDGYVKGSR